MVVFRRPAKSYGPDDATFLPPPCVALQSHRHSMDYLPLTPINDDHVLYTNKLQDFVFPCVGVQMPHNLALALCPAPPFSRSLVPPLLLPSPTTDELTTGSIATFLVRPLPLAAEDVLSPSGVWCEPGGSMNDPSFLPYFLNVLKIIRKLSSPRNTMAVIVRRGPRAWVGVRRGQPPFSGSFVAPALHTYESIETMNAITDQANHTEGVASRTHTFHRIDVRVFCASCRGNQRRVDS